MSDTHDKKDMWFQYLTKINDRALNKRRASGVTTWAVAGVIAYLGFQILNRVTLFTTNTANNSRIISLHIISLAATINLSFFVILFLAILLIKGDSKIEHRLATRLDRAASPAGYVPLFSVVIFAAALNFYSISPVAAHNMLRWPFVTVGGFFAIQVVGPLLLKASLTWRNRKSTAELPVLSVPFYIASDKIHNSFTTIMLFISLFGLAISFVPVIQAMPHLTEELHITTITWSFQVTALVFLFLWLCFRMVGLLSEQHLERLERRIVLEDLSADDIQSLYVREFLGQTIQDWLSDVEREQERLHILFLSTATDAEKEFADIAVIDRKLTYEITGRTKRICDTVKQALDNYVKYSNELVQKLQYLRGQKAFISAPDLTKQLTTSWDKQLEEIKSRYIKTCTKCQEAVAGLPNEVFKADVPDCLLPVKTASNKR